jgi:hypothetical protein
MTYQEIVRTSENGRLKLEAFRVRIGAAAQPCRPSSCLDVRRNIDRVIYSLDSPMSVAALLSLLSIVFFTHSFLSVYLWSARRIPNTIVPTWCLTYHSFQNAFSSFTYRFRSVDK